MPALLLAKDIDEINSELYLYYPTGEKLPMGNYCIQGSTSKTFICGTTSPSVDSTTWYIGGDDPLRNSYAWDISNRYFWINFG